MLVTIYNKKKLVCAFFETGEFDSATKGYISFLIHSQGWKKNDCEIQVTIREKRGIEDDISKIQKETGRKRINQM